MARTPAMAAGGIVLRQAKPPLVAVVRLRKRNEWVLPKGKLDDGETPRAAAEREVLEETGHAVAVHEFLGTLVYEARGGSKVVHYWRMEAGDAPVRELMRDVRAVDWLPLGDAVERLSRGYERAFLENVGPIALSAAAHAASTTRPRPKPAVEKPRAKRSATTPPPTVTAPPSQPDLSVVQDDRTAVMIDAFEAEANGDVMPSAVAPPFALEVEPAAVGADATRAPLRKGLIQKMRDWLRRAV
ncbi:NUDIX hydrolase [Afipia sp. GAS231]|uniref:NUDIX hydrolase n=1 Tax=Afipia sp. GAS231 TaxID=1882747 RepID=UPI000879F51C|nr:NUDIX hydrolase [Afipia sp. GAS231]SDN62924.1 8-oxo-dGTP diphosphatase [Afipia sp. GAS231]